MSLNQLTSLFSLFQKLRVLQLFKDKFFTEPEGSLLYSKQFAIWAYPEPVQSSPHLEKLFLILEIYSTFIT